MVISVLRGKLMKKFAIIAVVFFVIGCASTEDNAHQTTEDNSRQTKDAYIRLTRDTFMEPQPIPPIDNGTRYFVPERKEPEKSTPNPLVQNAQNWTKEAIKDRWGDITGYKYEQGNISAVAHGDKDVSAVVVFVWNPGKLSDFLFIGSRTLGNLEFHPGSGFLDESITFSLRSNGITSTYSGMTVSSSSSWDVVGMYVIGAELINKLHSPGQWDVLMEGRKWYIRTTIKGNLPRQ
jgi:hypothetical protein